MTSRHRSSGPPAELEAVLLQRNGRRERSEIRFQCPHPDRHRNGDANPSARYQTEKRVWCCDVCEAGGGWTELCDLLGVQWRQPANSVETRYRYADKDGAVLFEVVRRGNPKRFVQCRRDGAGGWTWNTKGIRKVLYRLPEVLSAVQQGGTIYLVEGEKDADNLAGIGLVATTNPGGAGKWKADYTETLRGARVVVLPDNDEPGRNHADKVAAALQGIAKEVRVVRLPGLGPGGDVSDWMTTTDRHGADEEAIRTELEQLVAATPVSEPADEQPSNAPAGHNPYDDAHEALQVLWALGPHPEPSDVQGALARIATELDGANPLAVQTAREVAVRGLKGKVRAPAKFVDAALAGVAVAPHSRPTLDPDGEEGAPYQATEHGLVYLKATKDGIVPVPLTNFNAFIATEILRDDGVEIRRSLEIETQHRGREHRFEVSSTEFPTLRWVGDHLGATAIVNAGLGTRDHARAAIQHLSDDVDVRTVFSHIGWRNVGGRWCYLHAKGAIGADGAVSAIEVDPPAQLLRYALPEPPSGADLVRAIQASLGLLQALPDVVALPLFCTIWRSVVGLSDFSLHLVGQTGEGKTEAAALAQQHFGLELNARSLPGSWLSTGNSLEILAFAAKDALLVIDDFAPGGSRFDVQRHHKEAARLLRAKGNQSGRGRLRPDGTPRPVKEPRALVLSTGEDVPAGHSVRARLFVIEIPVGSMDWEQLTRCQDDAGRGLYAQAMASFLRWLAPQYDQVKKHLRHRLTELRQRASTSLGQHRRTPGIVADLAVGMELFTAYAHEAGAVSEEEAQALQKRTWDALMATAQMQLDHLADVNPVNRFLDLLRSALVTGRAHVTSEHGHQPAGPEVWGWRRTTGTRDEWQPQGNCIGWVRDVDLYLDPDAAFKVALQMSSDEGLSATSRTLWKRLREAEVLATTDEKRSRNTIRVTLQGARREVLHISSRTLMAGKPSQLSQTPQEGDGVGVAGTVGGDGPVYAAPHQPPTSVPGEGSDAMCPASGGTVGTVGTVSATEGLNLDDDGWEEA